MQNRVCFVDLGKPEFKTLSSDQLEIIAKMLE